MLWFGVCGFPITNGILRLIRFWISDMLCLWFGMQCLMLTNLGCMRNCVYDFLILRRFDLYGHSTRAPVTKSVIWSPPAPGWIKVNTDGAAVSSPCARGCRGVFCNCRAFVRGCFVVPLGQVFAF